MVRPQIADDSRRDRSEAGFASAFYHFSDLQPSLFGWCQVSFFDTVRVTSECRSQLCAGDHQSRTMPTMLRLWLVTLLTGAASLSTHSADFETADTLWVREVEPLLDRNCFKCHGGVRQKSGLDLRSLENILKGGDHGMALVPGDPDASLLYQLVQKGADPHMPQDEKKQLAEPDIAAVRAWISALPGTNLVHAPLTNTAAWAQEYTKAFRALAKPTWIPSKEMETPHVVDRFLELSWKQRGLQPSARAPNPVLVRRLYLDLAGRIPTPQELADFQDNAHPDRWLRLVDALLASDDYATRMGSVFDVVLMERRDPATETQRRSHGWFDFLEHAFRANYGWDRIVRELIVGRPAAPQDRGAVWYLFERQNSHQAIAEAVAPIAFGVQIGCAQCHNHPLAAEVEQRHYWGLVAAFNRSQNVETESGSAVAESAIGGFVSFANLKKESQPAQLAFLNGCLVPEKRPGENEKESDSPDRYTVPPPSEKTKPARASVPRFSRREALADAATRGNPQLARAFVNRMWALLFGRGMVHPVDQLDSRHRPSHPDLLNWLAQRFEQQGYDIKRLIRDLVCTSAYQLDSRPAGESPPPVDSFACALEKPLSAEQLYRSFLVATGHPLPQEDSAQDTALRQAFTRQFPDLFPGEYSASLQQATFLSNSPLIDQLLQSKEGNTMARLLALDSNERRIYRAFEATLARLPDSEEYQRCAELLAKRGPEAGLKQIFWALTTSAEFQLNH